MQATADQQRRWAESIEGLDWSTDAPPHERLAPTYRYGSDRIWQIKLADGRIGWAQEDRSHKQPFVTYRLPVDVCDEQLLSRAAQKGHSIAEVMMSNMERVRDAIHRGSPARLQQYEAEAIAAESRLIEEPKAIPPQPIPNHLKMRGVGEAS